MWYKCAASITQNGSIGHETYTGKGVPFVIGNQRLYPAKSIVIRFDPEAFLNDPFAARLLPRSQQALWQCPASRSLERPTAKAISLNTLEWMLSRCMDCIITASRRLPNCSWLLSGRADGLQVGVSRDDIDLAPIPVVYPKHQGHFS